MEYQADPAGKPEGCCLQDASEAGVGELSCGRTMSWTGAKLLFARLPAAGRRSDHQTVAEKELRPGAKVLFARSLGCWRRSRSCWRTRLRWPRFVTRQVKNRLSR